MNANDELRQQWINAAPNDCFIFAQLMQQPDLCSGVLERFLQIEIDHIEYIAAEETIDVDYFSKGIRLDVFVKDDAGSIYNVEMQRRDPGNLPKRSRYYQNLIDIKMLNKGQDYKMLTDSFVIFISNFDPFDRDRCVYRFEYCDTSEPGLRLNDGTVKLFFNTRGTEEIDPELREILNFFENTLPPEKAQSALVQAMTDEFYRIKANKELEVSFVTQRMWERDIREEYLPLIEEMNQELTQKKAQLAEKDGMIAESKAQLAEKDGMIAEKDSTIAESKAQLAEKDDEIAQLKAMLREALSKLDAKVQTGL